MLRGIRTSYQQNQLIESDVAANPLDQFMQWLNESIHKDINEPTAMVLSTVDAENRPHSRVVLLKECTQDGFVFFTNYNSAKAEQISKNMHVALTFFWPEMERQVRVNGVVKKTSKAYSEAYFQERPIESRLASWASAQSQIIGSRKELEEKYTSCEQKFGSMVPRPLNWGGYLVKPYQIEFWQGRPNRLHDRICFQLKENKKWRVIRLAP